MMRNLSVLSVLLLVAAIACPAMADTCTFTNSVGDNDYSNANNWLITGDNNGPAYGWGDDTGTGIYPEGYGTAGSGYNNYTNWETLVYGAGAIGTDTTDVNGTGYQLRNTPGGATGCDIVNFVGTNGFTVNGGWPMAAPYVINVLGQATFTVPDPVARSNNNQTNTPHSLTINTIVGSRLITAYDGLYGNGVTSASPTIINGGGTVTLNNYTLLAPSFVCNLQLNADAQGHSPTVNLFNEAYGQEVETLVGTGNVNFSAANNLNPNNSTLDSTAGFTGNVSFESTYGTLTSAAITGVNIHLGDYASLGFNAANSVMTGGSITGGGQANIGQGGWGNGLSGNVVCGSYGSNNYNLTLLGTAVAPSTSGGADVYVRNAQYPAGQDMGQLTASAAGILRFTVPSWTSPVASLTLGKNNGAPCQFNIAVVGTNQVAGVDFSQIRVDGTIASVSQPTGNPLADTGLVVNITKGLSHGVNATNIGIVGTDPFAGETLTILTVSATDLSKAKFGAGVVGKDIQFVGGSATVNYFADGNGGGYVTLSNIFSDPTLAGDINNDGLVDVADYNIWAANVGKTGATWFQGDLNGDGLVDVADYNIWAANVGKTAATPEPISMIILAIGSGLVALKRSSIRRPQTEGRNG